MFKDKINRKENMKKIEIEKMNEEKSLELRELNLRIEELNNELNPIRSYHVNYLKLY